MKLLVVSDLHYSLKQFDWVTEVSNKFDLVAAAGDLLDQASSVDLDTQIQVVLRYLRRWRSNAFLLVSSGNHDLNARNEFSELAAKWLRKAGRSGAVIDGEQFEADGVLFSVCPWWDGEASFQLVVEQLQRDQRLRKGKWIWLYHAPPDRTSLSWTGKVYFGDEKLGGLIDRFRPDLVFCGHVHQAPFRKGGSWVEKIGDTVVFNAGMQMGAPPAFITVDTVANTATWHSQMADELIHFSRPAEKVSLS